MAKYKTHIIWAIVVIVALAGGFFWGKASGAAARASGFSGAFNSSSTRGFVRTGSGAATAGAGAIGQITAIGSSSLTLQLANGNSEVVLYSASTPVMTETTVSPSALSVGTNVVVAGTTNSDGSVTATTIDIRPAGAAGGYGGGNGTSTGQ